MVHYSAKLQSNQGLPSRKHHQRKRLRLSGQDPLGSPRKGIHDGPEDTHAINMFNDRIANAQRLEGIVNTKRFREGNDRSQGDRCQSGRSGAIPESWPALDVVRDEVVRVLSRFVLSVSGVLGMNSPERRRHRPKFPWSKRLNHSSGESSHSQTRTF